MPEVILRAMFKNDLSFARMALKFILHLYLLRARLPI